ncbi:MAG: hypothetical protein CMJ18_12635 [Phycisphaeraceae bacterium]|nr:hypothetical protein [Phycisphaeraceae bacterium]
MSVLFAASAVCHGADYTVHLVEPAVTDHLILRDGPLPRVCRNSSRIRLSGCRGQHEPASFVVTAAKRLKAVRVEAGPISGDDGTWPEDALDLRVVKEYYVRSTAGPMAAVPMLLVHDDSFLAIEPAPTEEDPDAMKNVARGPLRDASRLQPVDIEKRRQFWVTVRIPDDADPGTYTGRLRIVPQNGAASELTLEIEVYPFDLEAPMLEYSIYYPVRLAEEGESDWRSEDGWRSVARLTPDQYRIELENMVAHGLTNPNIYGGVGVGSDGSLDGSKMERILSVREEAGVGPGVPLYTMNAAAEPVDRALTDDEKTERIELVREVKAWYRGRGYPDVYWAAHDEAWGDWLARERDSMQAIHDGGGKVFVACSGDFFKIVGDVLHRPVLFIDLTSPLDAVAKKRQVGSGEALRSNAEFAQFINFERYASQEKYRRAIDGVHRLGRKIFTYSTYRAPLPDWQRRHEGLGLWRMGFDGVMNWAYCHINGEGANQAMHFAMVFRVDGGVLDTLHWEGFREGVDDVRYLTTLLTTLNKVQGYFPDDPLIAETRSWLGAIDAAGGDLNAIRREMAQRIIALQDLGHEDLTPAEALAGIDVERIRIVALDEPWRFKLVELDVDTVMGPDQDAADEGLQGRWFDPTVDDSQWTRMRVGTGYTRETGGGWGNKSGYGWYRTELPLANQDADRFRYVHFSACDEDTWVYLNGREILEHSLESTGLLTSEIWITPFVVPLNDAALRGNDLLAVRVRNTEAMGGIWRPVRMVVSDRELTDQQVKAVIELDTAKE